MVDNIRVICGLIAWAGIVWMLGLLMAKYLLKK